MRNFMLSYFLDVDLRCSHIGLGLLAKKAKKPVHKLKIGEFLLFVNTRQNAVKIITCDNVLIHIKSDHGGPLNFRAINMLPKYFNGSGFNYEGALKEAIEKQLNDRYIRSKYGKSNK